MSGLAAQQIDHEQVIVRRGTRSGAQTIVAVHSTALGPALGGCRMWHYESAAEGLRDALALSRAMTLKSAAAGLALGGGKGVICQPLAAAPAGPERAALLSDFADTVESLGGAYITAEDVGTDSEDMARIAQTTSHVVGLPGASGDPSPFTAAGVKAAIRACLLHAHGSPELAGRSVAVVGCGHVGAALARELSGEGARLVLSDVDPTRRQLVGELPSASWAAPEEALRAEVDVLAPCALGGVIDERAALALRCAIVCGAANNQLAHDDVAQTLHDRGILYAPDFIVNAGGLINVAMELTLYDRERALRRVAMIEEVLGEVLGEARRDGVTPLAASRMRAHSRLSSAARVASGLATAV